MTRTVTAALFLWAGLLLGVSFVATPAKFLAPSLPLVQALDVGRWTFHVLERIEWAVAIPLVGSALAFRSRLGHHARWLSGLLIAILTILAVQTFAIRPILDARVLQIIAGNPVTESSLHMIYIGLDIVRLGLLLAAGVISLRES